MGSYSLPSYYGCTLGKGPLTQPHSVKEVGHKTIQSRNDLDRFPQGTFEKKIPLRSYPSIIEPFCQEFGDWPIDKVTPDETLTFFNRLTMGNRPYTKRIRYSQLFCFFDFIRNNIQPDTINPCDMPMIRKLYRHKVTTKWEVIEKDVVDEVIFRTTKVRDRLILELMARGAMRIGEVLKLRKRDFQDQKLVPQSPKSGNEHEIVCIPQKVADRLRECVQDACERPEDRIFPISYEAARLVVIRAGKLVGIHLRPHDLHRHVAT